MLQKKKPSLKKSLKCEVTADCVQLLLSLLFACNALATSKASLWQYPR